MIVVIANRRRALSETAQTYARTASHCQRYRGHLNLCALSQCVSTTLFYEVSVLAHGTNQCRVCRAVENVLCRKSLRPPMPCAGLATYPRPYRQPVA